MNRKNGLNDSDKVLVTAALWIATIVIFVAALTLPMLPDRVTIFYRPIEGSDGQYYSKYNNLLMILLSLIPATIILVTALLKRRNRLQNNFISIMLFCIMLSILMCSVIIYGITEQFDASSSIKSLNFHALAVVITLFVISMLVSLTPMILHSPRLSVMYVDGTGYKWCVLRAMDKHWNVGAYGFLLCAIACVFVPDYFCYIPFVIFVAAYVVFVLVMGNAGFKKTA